MSKPPTPSPTGSGTPQSGRPAPKAAAQPQSKQQQELHRITQYLAHIYQQQKKLAEQISGLAQRLSVMEASIQAAIEKAISPLIEKINSTLEEQLKKALAGLKAQPAPAPAAPTPAAPAAPAPQPAPAAPTAAAPSGVRRPSQVPSVRISTVLEALDSVTQDLAQRQKIQNESLRMLLESARDTVMDNLSSRTAAVRVFRNLIAMVKSSPFEVPRETIKKIVDELTELRAHIAAQAARG